MEIASRGLLSEMHLSQNSLRTIAAETGGFAAVLRRGVAEAGAIFIVHRSREGEVTLYGPAAQAAYDEEGKPRDRRFARVPGPTDDETVRARLDKEMRFDPDLWVVEIETGRPEDEELFPVTMP